jgi:CBS domain-containing membrane protein
MTRLLPWLRTFWPAPLNAGGRERVFGCVGALLGLSATEWIGHVALGESNPWFVAPMGASAVLLFAVPSSPLAQPWSILGGNLVSALIGITCAQWLGHSGLSGALAVAVSIGVMFQLRCLHPPGGAVALTTVLGGPAVHAMGYQFALWPVAVNSLCMLLVALAFNNVSQRRYPHRPQTQPQTHGTADPPPSERAGITRADFDAVLKAHGEQLDISSEDLEELLQAVERRAYRRRFGEINCGDMMSRDILTVGPQLPLGEAWEVLVRHRIKALPVVQAPRGLVGILSLHDFLVSRDSPSTAEGARVDVHPQIVADLMSTEVVTVRAEQPIVDTVPLFSDAGLHHLPVVDDAHNVIGMLTQSDLVAALFRAGLEQSAPAAGQA